MKHVDNKDYQPWLEKTGGFARDMTMLDRVALEVLPFMVANDETSHDEDVEAAFSVARRFLQAREDKRAQTSKLEQALMNLVVQVEEDVRASDMSRHLRDALADALELLKPNRGFDK
jgi:hypothetical protein